MCRAGRGSINTVLAFETDRQSRGDGRQDADALVAAPSRAASENI